MKTFTKRLTKTILALILVILMVLGTTATGFAAIVDNIASTGAMKIVSGAQLYFDPRGIKYWNYDSYYTQFCYSWQQSDTNYKTAGKIANTKLYIINDLTYDNLNYIILMNNPSNWSGANSYSNLKIYSTNEFHLDNSSYAIDNSNGSYMFTAGKADNKTTGSLSYVGSTNYGANFNSQQTIIEQVKLIGGDYANSTSAADISASGFQFNSNTSTTTSSASISKGSTNSKTMNAAFTSDVTLKYSNLDSNYKFDGWYNGTTSIGTGTSATDNIDTRTEKNTYYAKFSEKSHTVSVSANEGGSVSASSLTVGGVTSASVTATPNDGYAFSGWTATGCTVSDSSTATTNVTATADSGTLVANFVQTKYAVTISAGTGGSVSPSGSQQIGSSGTSITATPSTGYKFKNWTVTGGASVASTTSATTTATATATGTIKANFTKKTYTMSFNPNGGSGTQASGTKTHGEAYTLPSCSYTAPEGKKFSYWALNSSSGTQYNAGAPYTGNADATFYAVWVDAGSCELSFDVTSDSGVIYETKTHVAIPNQFHKGGTITYSSSDTSVATVNSSGTVTGLKPGTTTITASCSDAGSTSASYTYEVKTPSVSLSLSPASVNIGYTSTATATISNAASSGGSTTYSSGTTTVATISGTTITAQKDGTSVITATYTVNGQTYEGTATLTVNKPSFNPPADQNLSINGTYTITDPTVTNRGITGSFSYAVTSGDSVTISGKKLTAVKDGTSIVTITYTTNGNQYKETFNVTVSKPNPTISPETMTLLVGQNSTVSVSSTETIDHVAWSSSTDNVTLSPGSNNATVNALAEGSATISANVYYTSTYYVTATSTCVVTVNPATISVSPNAVSLDYYDSSAGSDYKGSQDITITLPSSDLTGELIVESNDTSIATVANKSGNTYTITSAGVGNTTVTVTYTPEGLDPIEEEVSVNVTAYDPYEVLYCTETHGWPELWVRYYGSDITTTSTKMVYLGNNENNQGVYAVKILKENYEKITGITFHKGDGWWGNYECTIDHSKPSNGNNAFWIGDETQSKDYTTRYLIGGEWKYDKSLPVIELEDIILDTGKTQNIQANIDQCSKVKWNIENSNIASISSASTKDGNNIINGLSEGSTTLSVRAYIDTNGTIKSNLQYDSNDAQDFISSEIVVNVNVSGTTLYLTASPEYSNNGTDYTPGTAGGTAAVNPTECQYNESATFTAITNPGYRFVGWFNSGSTTPVSESEEFTLDNIKTDVDLIARFIKTYQLTVDTTSLKSYTGTPGGTKDVGTEITLSGTVDNSKYISGWTVNGTEETGETYTTTLTSDITASPIIGSKYQVIFKDTTGIDITGKQDYYKAGDSVAITLAAKEHYNITSVKAYTDEECTQEYAGFTCTTTSISGTMPEQNIYITYTFTSSFTVTVEGKFRDYEATDTSFDIVTDITPSKEQIAEDGGSVTFTAAIKDSYKDFFQVVGWFSDADCTKLLTTNSTYTVTPTQDMIIYPLVVRKMYGGAWNNSGKEVVAYQLLKYDYTNGQYYLSDIPYSDGNGFKFFDNPNMGADNADTKWKGAQLGTSYGLTLNRAETKDNATFSDLVTNYGSPVTAWFDPNGFNGAGAIYAKASYNKATIYLSYGRYNIDEFTSISEFVDIDYSQVSDEQTLYNDGSTTEIAEKYIFAGLSPIRTISVETKLSGYKASDYEVAAFVIYDSESNAASAVTDISYMGNNTYSATIPVKSTCYICPVFQTKGDGQYITVDANAISDWGPLVAAYGYTADITQSKTNGKWPGQLMIPSADGKSYTMKISGNTGNIVINNYMVSSLVNNKKTVPDGADIHDFFYKLSDTTIKQTYDYEEFSILKNHDFSSIAFTIKKNKDGYHGDSYNSQSATTKYNVKENTNINTSIYSWDYLYGRDGKTKMTVTNEELTETPVDTLYIVSKGDIKDENEIGYWAVKWFVYDSDGKYLTSVFSNKIFDTTGGSASNNKLVQAITSASGKTEQELKSYEVKISYEAANKGLDYEGYSTQTSYDGQWHGNLSSDTIRAQVVVGKIDNGAFVPRTSDPLNVDTYGKAYIANTEDQYKDVPYSDTRVGVEAIPLAGYKFVGWYLKNDDGEFVYVSEALTYNTSISNNMTFYAFFEEIGEDELYVTNQKYINTNAKDESLLSHDGTASMKIAIYEYVNGEKGSLINEGVISEQLSSATTTVKSRDQYYIEITSTPLNKGTFYAFYTDAVTPSGEKTYEEVLTEKEDVGRTDTIVKHFIYTASGEGETINIYTDCTKVDNTTRIVYKYIDRFGKEKTYTAVNNIVGDENFGTKFIPLTDDECLGYEGNDFNAYCPTYLTKYTMTKDSQSKVVYGKENRDKYIEGGWTETGYILSKVSNFAPTSIQADVINKVLSWEPENNAQTKIAKSLFTLTAIEEDVKYTVTYNFGDDTRQQTLGYNELLELKDVPKENDKGEKFAYWVNENDDVISPYVAYNMRVIKGEEITAVYNNSPSDKWNALIDNSVITREISDDSDTVYVDYTLHFANSLAKTLPEAMTDAGIADFGVIVVQNKDPYPGDGEFKYPSQALGANAETLVKTVASGSADLRNLGGYKCTRVSYATENQSYKLPQLTKPFNRCSVSFAYNNKDQAAISYNFSTYTYIRFSKGNYSISEATNIKLYEQACDPIVD